MKIQDVDMFYFALPEIRDIGDGSQDLLLVRVRTESHIGWGECEASPLASIAGLVAPVSHSACHPVIDSVVGQEINSPEDILRIGRVVRARSLDLLQASHTWSGIEIALWDLLGKAREVPVYELLGFSNPKPKTAYASLLFGATPQETLNRAKQCAAAGFRAVKFGWGLYGAGTVSDDVDQVMAAREGLGPDANLMVDAGTIWVDDVDAALARIPSLEQAGVFWLEEPFTGGAVRSYAQLAARSPKVGLAGGEGSHMQNVAETLIDHGGIKFVQIDCGRIGGIGPSAAVARYADAQGVQYVNHTFTSHLALSASLHAFAGIDSGWLCEYPVEASELAMGITSDHIEVGQDGCVRTPDKPGLGLSLDLEACKRYLVDVEISVAGKVLFRSGVPSESPAGARASHPATEMEG